MIKLLNKYLNGLFAAIYYGSVRSLKRKTELPDFEIQNIAKNRLFPFIYTSVFLAFIFADIVVFIYILLGIRLPSLHPIAYAWCSAILLNYIYTYFIFNFETVILEYKQNYESISNSSLDLHLLKYFLGPFFLLCLFFLMLIINLEIK
jgi:hypothetical protein